MRRQWVIIGFLFLLAWLFGIVERTSGHSAGAAGGSMLKAFLIPIATVYLNLFNSPSTALFLCAAMVVLAIVLFLYFFLGRVRPAIRELAAINSALQSVPARPGDADCVAQIDEIVRRYPLMKRSWQLYHATLSRDAGGRITSPFAAARYLNMRALEHAGLRLRFFLGMPNDFVGLGLIFTFLGLVAGLYFASKSMLSADLADARDALTKLLHAATFKFLTSITGIGLSMVMAGT